MPVDEPAVGPGRGRTADPTPRRYLLTGVRALVPDDRGHGEVPGGRTGVTVRRLREDEVAEHRWIRLRALASDPLAFGSTFASEAAFPPEVWVERTRGGATGVDRATWVADDGQGHLVGLVGAFPEPPVLVVVSMWVEPARRGEKLGERLMAALLAWAAETRPDWPLRLSVNPAQIAAVRLYERLGFQRTGEFEPLRHTPTVRLDVMVRPPRP